VVRLPFAQGEELADDLAADALGLERLPPDVSFERVSGRGHAQNIAGGAFGHEKAIL
jgi:hypothetical protein